MRLNKNKYLIALLVAIFTLHTNIYSKPTKATITQNKTPKIYVVSYIKDNYLKKNIEKFYKNISTKFRNIKIVFNAPKNEKFYKSFRKDGSSFSNTYMQKNKFDLVLILHQKKKNKKVKILSQKNTINAQRSAYVPIKKTTKEIALKRIISRSLKQLGEFFIISSSSRVL